MIILKDQILPIGTFSDKSKFVAVLPEAPDKDFGGKKTFSNWMNFFLILYNFKICDKCQNLGPLRLFSEKVCGKLLLNAKMSNFSALSWREQFTYRWGDDHHVHFVQDQHA